MPGSATHPAPGWDLRVLDGEGDERRGPGTTGAIVVRLPMPPGATADALERRRALPRGVLAAFPGHYQTGDAGYIDADGYVFVMSRTDDVINVAGHRLSTGAIEEVLAAHPDVARVRGARRRGRAEGPAAARPARPQGGGGAPARRDRREAVAARARADRAGRRVQDGRRRRTTAEDPLREDPPRHDAPDRRRRGVHDAARRSTIRRS